MRYRISTVAQALLIAGLVQGMSAAETNYVEGEVLVIFKPGFGTDAAKAALGRRALELDRHYRNISGRSGRVAGLVKSNGLSTAALIARLKADPEVETVEPNYLRRCSSVIPNDPDFPALWGLTNTGQTVESQTGTSGVDTNFLPAWRIKRPAPAEVVVGVLDTGVDIAHPDLAANIWTNPGEIPGNATDDDGNGYVDDVHGYNFKGGTATVTDSGDHGTHVAGTIAAVGKNQLGVIGIEPRAKILPLQASSDGDYIDTASALAAYSYAIALKQSGVNIVAINASFTGPDFSTIEGNAIAALRDNGIILCAAAGNEATNNDSEPSYPANYSTTNIISVAALDQINGLASFSNYGATSVDLAAPGENIYSTLPLADNSPSPGLTVGGFTYSARSLDYSGTVPPAGVSGSIHDCGLGYPEDFPPEVAGNLALIQRGTLTFAVKVTNAMNAGAVAAIIYDNTNNPLTSSGWTLGGPGPWIPSIQITKGSGEGILAQLPTSATLALWVNPAFAYQFLSGTSMACPHVAGAVALAALNFPAETMSQRITRILTNVTPVAALAGKMTTGGRLNLLKMIDTDEDGLPDWWETENFGTLPAESASGDDDADGFPNLDEFLAGTAPNDSASHLSFSAFTALEDGMQTHFELSFPSVEDRCYEIEWSNTLQPGSWQTLGTTIIGTGSLLHVQDSDAIHAADRRFYRMSVLHD
jgi:subtilisin family serine protease